MIKTIRDQCNFARYFWRGGGGKVDDLAVRNNNGLYYIVYLYSEQFFPCTSGLFESFFLHKFRPITGDWHSPN